jgi:hypothetical protein
VVPSPTAKLVAKGSKSGSSSSHNARRIASAACIFVGASR